MKKLLLLLLTITSIQLSFGATCTVSDTQSGNDVDPVTASVVPCSGAGIINNIVTTAGSSVSTGNCGTWYSFTLEVDHAGGTETALDLCAIAGINIATQFPAITDINSVTAVRVISVDEDSYAPGDAVSITLGIDVDFCASTTTCSESDTQSGNDVDPVTASVVPTSCTGGEQIYSIVTTAGSSVSTGNCGTWYSFTLEVDHAGGTETALDLCAISGINIATQFPAITDINSVTAVRVISVDEDSYAPGDAVSITLGVDVTHCAPACASPTALNASNITTTSADLNWTAAIGTPVDYNWEVQPAGTAQGAGVPVASGTAVAGTTVNTGTTLTGFTNYDFFIQTNCGGIGTSDWTAASSFFTGYCLPSYSSGGGSDNITEVSLNTLLDNTLPGNASPGYFDRKGAQNAIPDLSQGVTESLSVTMGTDGNQWSGVWIDFNQNLDFEASEFFTTGSNAGGSGTAVISIAVPPGATLGNTVMRIRGADDSQMTSAQACGASNSNWGMALDYNVNVTLPPACSVPADLTATSITATSADIEFTCVGCSGSYIVEYSTTMGFVPGTGLTAGGGTIMPGASSPISLAGLTAETTYYYTVRQNCTGTFSTNANEQSFTTPCVALVAPLVEPFDAATIPACWNQSATTGGPWVFTSSGLGTTYCQAGIADHTGNAGNFAALDYSNTISGVILTSPIIDVTALTTPELKFFYYSCNDDDAAINDLHIEAWDGSVWTSIDLLVTTDPAGWIEYKYDLSTFTYGSNLVQIRFRGETGSLGGFAFYNDQHIDDFEIREAPLCPEPTIFSSSNITETTADLTWLAGGSETDWNIEFKAGVDFVPGTLAEDGTATASGTPTATLSSLDLNTTYYVYVQANCGALSTSTWIGTSFITKDCAAIMTRITNEDIVACSGYGTVTTVEEYDGWVAVPGQSMTNIPSNITAASWAPNSRPNADGSCCSGNNPGYTVIPIQVDITGTYLIEAAWDFDGYMFLYTDPFDLASNPATTYIDGDDDFGGTGGSILDGTAGDAGAGNVLTVGENYYVILSGWSGNGNATSLTFSGAGNVLTEDTVMGTPSLAGYTYEYIITNTTTGNIEAKQASPDLTGFATGTTYEVCGFHYLTAQAGDLLAADGTIDKATYIAAICGESSSNCVNVDMSNYDITSPIVSSLGTTVSTNQCTASDGYTYYFNDLNATPGDADDIILLGLNHNGNNLDAVNVSIDVLNGVGVWPAASPGTIYCPSVEERYMGRTWDVTVGTQPTSDVDVRFFYDAAEFNTFATETQTLVTSPSSYQYCYGAVTTTADMHMSVIESGSVTGEIISSLTYGTAQSEYVDFSMSHFTGGALHSSGGVGGAALPVELISFEASSKEKAISLNWITATEINNAGFDIERSLDGENFTKISFVEGNGNSNKNEIYSFLDKDVSENITYYYRLKQVDFDGQFEYTRIVSAKIVREDSDSQILTIYPNPSTGTVYTEIAFAGEFAKVQIDVYTVLGSKVTSKNVTISNGINKLAINDETLAVGTYFVKVNLNDKITTHKFSITK